MNIDVLQKRIRLPELRNKVTSAEAAAEHVKDGMTVGMSGFTLAGCVKSVPHAIAKKAATHPLKISVITGASLGNDVDSALTNAGVMARRSPFQTDRTLRNAINRGEIMYVDNHLSETGEQLRRQQVNPLMSPLLKRFPLRNPVKLSRPLPSETTKYSRHRQKRSSSWSI